MYFDMVISYNITISFQSKCQYSSSEQQNYHLIISQEILFLLAHDSIQLLILKNSIISLFY